MRTDPIQVPITLNGLYHDSGLTSSQILPFLQLFGNLKLPLSPPNGRGITAQEGAEYHQSSDFLYFLFLTMTSS
ncbi:hypothetical protein Csa_016129 [Cucumis sativus]|uniref:Uncharacterized protein n=1 Tax=Cucumis sativus TaxID=3659 RepID=A0A0A0K4P0_CUCSA|nr:hypothetical protein Csa_016129 [Cucumis sativus]